MTLIPGKARLVTYVEVEVNIFKGIGVVSISAPDLDQARQFYRDVLGLGEPIYELSEADWIGFGSGYASGNIAITRAEADWQPGHNSRSQ